MRTAAIFVVLLLSALGVIADGLLKRASQRELSLHNGWFFAGFVLYASTAFGWVFAMRHLKLANIGVVYCLATVLMLAAMGSIVFGESLRLREVIGIALAFVSLVLMSRFA